MAAKHKLSAASASTVESATKLRKADEVKESKDVSTYAEDLKTTMAAISFPENRNDLGDATPYMKKIVLAVP
jgi:hypothetical protein